MKFLKTYGKRTTKLSAWVSIQDRKQVFDSTSASEADTSTQASKTTRIRNARNAAKKKAPPLQLTSEDEENNFTLPLSQKKTARRGKPNTVCLVRARKRKLLSLSLSSDEENVPPTLRTKAADSKKTRRKVSRVFNDKNTCDKTADPTGDGDMCPPVPSQNSVRLPSAGRFVTRRRCAAFPSPKPLTLNSSDEFSASQNIRPSRIRHPPVFLESSADGSVHAAVLRSFVTVPLRDISLNESAEHSLGPCARKPIFCSTPSAAPLGKRSKRKSFNPTSSPPSISVSCIGPVSTFHAEELPPTPHASPSESSIDKQAGIGEIHTKELRDSPFSGFSKTSSSGAAHSRCEEGPIHGSHEMPSVVTIGSDLSSCFTSATGEFEWISEFLKEKCLTQLCTVRLERVEDLIKLFNETTYSSCLGDLGSVSSNAKEHSRSVDTSQTSQHKASPEPTTSPELAVSELQSVESSSVQYIRSVIDSHCTEPDDGMMSEQKSSSDLFSESDNGCTDPADMQAQDRTEELSTLIKSKCLSRECSVQLKKLPPSSIEQHLTPESNHSENDHSRAKLSQKNSTTVCRSPLDESETEDKAKLTKVLKEKCLDGFPLVKIRKMSRRESKHKLQESAVVLNRNASALVGEQTEPESNCAVASPKETSLEVGRCGKMTSASSNEQAVSDKDVIKRRSNKTKKLSLAPKEKKCRTSTHRPGTTRKACVSGLSVSRWKNGDAFTSGRGGMKAVDCSINDLIPNQHRQPVELSDFNKNFSTPVKGRNLNLSSLMGELTPSTHTWSRLKAALSIHRKVMLTPKTPGPGQSSKAALADLSWDLFGTPFRTPLPKRLRSQLMTHESQLVFEDDELSDAEKVYAECGQQCPLPWEECLLPQRMKRCVKIGEGTFGEVFSTTSGKSDGDTVALKVIPVEGSEKVNGEEQKTFGEILHEIIISKELSCLKEKENNQTSGFIGLRE
uniref:Protein kinase domain-containing protein n=1 Tax=Neogobius melanostomus TaxID=47308 RepID=A0A8C6WKS3_9GOBI